MRNKESSPQPSDNPGEPKGQDDSSPAIPKWKKFEQLTHSIQSQLGGNAEVKLNDSILGVDSKVSRQIDISIRQNVAQYSILIIVDCKDHREPVDVKGVEEFVGLVRDVRAHKGALVSSSGFTPGAVESAKAHGLDTYRLVDTESVDWKSYVTIPVLLQRTAYKGFRAQATGFQSLPSSIQTMDIRYLNVFAQDGTFLGTVRNLVAQQWNGRKGEWEPGEHHIVLGENVLLEIGQDRVQLTLTVILRVNREWYFGPLPVHLQGFQDLQNGGVITREMTTDNIEPYRIEQGLVEGWSQIENPNLLAVRPVMTLIYSDHL